MACDWCEKNKVLERIEDDLFLCDDCRDRWGRMEYYGSRTEP